MGFFVVSLVLLFYVELNRCSSYAESWVGLLAPQVCLPHSSSPPGCKLVLSILNMS